MKPDTTWTLDPQNMPPWLAGPLGIALLLALVFLLLCYLLAPYYIYRTFSETRRARLAMEALLRLMQSRPK